MTNPNHDQWTATNAQEALNLLNAAEKLIEARLMALHPDATLVNRSQKKNVALRLQIDLDLTELHTLVAETRALQADADDYTA
jgi:hypothetical protein